MIWTSLCALKQHGPGALPADSLTSSDKRRADLDSRKQKTLVEQEQAQQLDPSSWFLNSLALEEFTDCLLRTHKIYRGSSGAREEEEILITGTEQRGAVETPTDKEVCLIDWPRDREREREVWGQL